MSREFKLPDLGEGITEAQIVRVLVKEGDTIEEDHPILEVETDKAAVEIPSPMAGLVQTVHVKEGQTVAVGDVMITFGNGAEASDVAIPARRERSDEGEAKPGRSHELTSDRKLSLPPVSSVARPPISAPPAGPRMESSSARGAAAAAPAVRKLARDLGVNIDGLTGTGPGGRVTREDVERAAAGGNGREVPSAEREAAPAEREDRPAMARSPAAIPKPVSAPPPGVADADKWGPVRRAPLSQIRKTIAAQMTRSAYTIPHVTGFDFADITELEKLRKSINADEKAGVHVTLLAFIMKALGHVLPRHPIFNASYDHEKQEILYKDYLNIGVAVDTERGLIVPVIRNVERMSLLQISEALTAVGEKVRATQFAVEDLRGGTFTITNVGAIGGTFFTPIINYPESAILGLGRSSWQPAVVKGRIKPRYILPIGLTIDHRIADGAQSARCLNEIIGYLKNPGQFLLT